MMCSASFRISSVKFRGAREGKGGKKEGRRRKI